MPSLRPRALAVLAVLAHALIMWWTFKHMIAPSYGSVGLTYRAPHPGALTAMLAVTVLVALALPRRLDRPSAVILWIVFTFTAAPSIQFPQYLQLLPVDQASQLGLMVAGGFLLARGISAAPPIAPQIKPLPTSPATFGIVLAGLSIAVFAVILYTTGISLQYLSFDQVYGVRAEFVDATAGVLLIGYGLPIIQNVVNPLLMGVGLLKRRYSLVAIAVAAQVVIYLTVGTKNTLFSILFVLAIAPLVRRGFAGALIPLGMACVAAAAAIVDLFTRSVGLTVLTTRRVLMVPGALTAAWVSIYSVLPQLHFAELGLADPPALSPVRTVGRIFVGDVDTAANVSMFGHGYAQLGLAGLLIECAFFGVMLRWADWSTRGLPPVIAAAMFIMPAQAICEASIFTAFVTHGFLAAVVIAALAPRTGWCDQRRERRETSATTPDTAPSRMPTAMPTRPS